MSNKGLIEDARSSLIRDLVRQQAQVLHSGDVNSKMMLKTVAYHYNTINYLFNLTLTTK